MPENPLQKHFRQPKIFISLPSKGVYNNPGTIRGDVTRLPVYGMTGMDEIIIRTPEALLTGESTVRIIQSCCPNIVDAWSLTALDTELVLTSIKIATYGNKLEVKHTCPECKTLNDYELDLGKFIEHYAQFKYNNTVQLDELSVKIQPLTYKQATDFNLRNFGLQQRMAQALALPEGDERNKMVADLFQQLSVLQNEIYAASVESVELPDQVVTEQTFIQEWLRNSEKSVLDQIKMVFEDNTERLKTPNQDVECDNCHHVSSVSVELDQSNFFVKA